MKTLIVQNYWTPYRSDLFEALSGLTDIEVLYLGNIGSDRLWEMEKVKFKYISVQSNKKGPFIFSNISNVDFSIYDQVVVLEHMENIFTVLKIIKKFPDRFFLWSGMFNNMYPDKPLYGGVVDLFKRVYRPFLYRARGYFAYSSLTRDMFLSCGVASDKIEIIKQASRVVETGESEQEYDINLIKSNRKPLKVLSLGYLRKEKNNDFLIRVCSRFTKEELILTVVGNGPEKENLENIAGNNIVLKDYLEGEAKSRVYTNADLFILPTIRDPWALTVNEAMFYGLPVICSNRAGVKDIIDGNGYIIDPWDEEELFNILRGLVSIRDRVPEMGKRSKAIIAEYSIEKAAEQLAGILLK